jgi:uncharacterized protein (DUF952 family)
MSRPTLHLVAEERWLAHDPGVAYLPEGWERDGFIHCTDGDAEMVAVANRLYVHDPRSFLVLTVDLERVGSPWRFDDPDRRYPHVYGALDPSAVSEVRRMRRDQDGRFIGIDPAGAVT